MADKKISIEVSRCQKNGNPIRNVSFSKKRNIMHIVATQKATTNEIEEAALNELNKIRKNTDKYEFCIEEQNSSHQTQGNHSLSDKLLLNGSLSKLKKEFKHRILRLKLQIICPYCNQEFNSLYEAIGHAKQEHPLISILPVELYREAYIQFFEEFDTTPEWTAAAESLLAETENKLREASAKIEEKRIEMGNRDNLRRTNFPNTWEAVFSQRPTYISNLTKEPNIVLAGRVDSNRRRH